MGILNILKALSKGLIKEDAAAKKIAELGYPESVAKRIASGELPMDEASRMARAKNQKRIDTYHASKQDFNEFKAGYSDDMAFTTPDPEFANNWLGKGKYQERLGAADEIHELRKKQRDLRASFFDYDELDKLSKQGKDAEWKAAYDRMQQSYKDAVKNDVAPDRTYDTIYPMMPKAEKTFDPRTDYEKILPVLEKSVGNLSDDTIKSLKRGDYLWYESKDVADWLRANGYDSILLSESGGDITTLASLYPNTMRSKFAAFDDEYTGPNILGSAAPLAVGTTATAITGGLLSNQAEAAPFKKIGEIAKGLLGKTQEQGEELPPGLLADPKQVQPLRPIKKKERGNVQRAYRGGSDRMWTEDGEMSVTGGKQKTSDIGAWSSSNPGTGESYAKPIGFGGALKTGQVAPVDITMDTVATVEHPNRLTQVWSNLPKEMVVKFPDGKEMTIGEMYPNATRPITTDDIARTIKQNFPETGGVRFKSLIDAGPHDWDPQNLLHPTEKRGASQDSYAIWDESIMKGAYAKGEGPGFMNSVVLPVLGGGTLTYMAAGGNDAEAAPLPVTIGRLVQLGFITADKVGNPSAVKSATTKYNKTMRADRRFAANERMAYENEYQTFLQKHSLDAPRQTLDLSTLENKPVMGILSDRSMKGEITQVGGIPLETPTQAEGGMMFPRAHQDEGAGWMSMYKTAKPVQQKIIDIAEDTGESPIILPMAMGENATNFATPVADIMFKQVKANPPKKTAIKQFDTELRKSYPDWVGLEHPGAYDQLMGVGDFPMEGAGKMRTAFSTIMGKAEYRNQGFPSYNAALNAVNDPAFEGMPIGTMGFTSFKGMPDVDAYRQLGLHGSYDTIIPGQYSGATELPFFAREIFGDAFKHLDVEMTKPKISKKTGKMTTPRPFTEEEKINAIATRGARPDDPDAPITSYEMMTPKRVDELGAAMDRKKELAKKYGTYGAALLGLGGAGNVMAEPAATFDTQQPPQDDFDRLVGMVTKRKPQPQQMMPERDPLDVSMAGIQRKPDASFGGIAADTAGAFGTGLAKGTVDTLTNLPRDVGGLIGMMPFMDEQKATVIGGLLNSVNQPVRDKIAIPDYQPSYMMSDQERDKVQGFGALIPGLLF